MRGLSLAAASGGHSSSRCAGLSLSRPLFLRSTDSRRAGSVVVAHGPSCSAACGILPDQGSNPCPLHWQADSQPLRHQGSPYIFFRLFVCLGGDGEAAPISPHLRAVGVSQFPKGRDRAERTPAPPHPCGPSSSTYKEACVFPCTDVRAANWSHTSLFPSRTGLRGADRRPRKFRSRQTRAAQSGWRESGPPSLAVRAGLTSFLSWWAQG